MNKRTMKKGLAIVLALVMVFAMTATAFAETNSNITVYVTVERTLLSNQDPVLAPTKVVVPTGSTVMDVLNKLKTQVEGFDFTSSGSVAEDTAYIKGFKVPSHAAFNYHSYIFYDEYYEELEKDDDYMAMYFEDYAQFPAATDLFLEAGDYCMLGGWIVSANNQIIWDDTTTTAVNEAYPTASSVIREDNTVLRFEYSLALARDCGYDGWNLMNPNAQADAFYNAADKSELVRKMAENPNSSAYAAGMTTLKNMVATQSAVNNAVALFE